MNRWLAALLAALLGAAGFLLLQPASTVRASVHFGRVVGLYPGSDVRILGVKVGEVTAVTPVGDRVRVDLAYDAGRKVPADAQAVIVARSVVADRYVQLAPPYTGGAVLRDGATLAAGRTPVEIDEALRSFNTLTRALGPDGANADGSLSRLLKASADTFGGQGATVGASVRSLSDAAAALAGNRDEFSQTIRNLALITGTMAEDDTRIRAFMRDLATASGQLNAERDELRAVFKGLSRTLTQVADFVDDNRAEITTNTRDLAHITKLLVRQRASIETFLQTAPLAVNNANNAYDPRSGTFRARIDLNGQSDDLAMWLCSLAYSMGTPPAQCEPLLKPLNPLGQALNHAGLDASALLPDTKVERPDITVGGLLPPGRKGP
ncbi:MCE family protein [Nonomuraea endophytica]|uniref:Phospholipid/cholesterol/gamma-HCH transport system substrate-binding protein n=1 Tax=Nonomuraea endophytica TaxID=714136 RepID=A0A7W8A3B8_9ACTN|nr:MCE family protein [Nonomuraea endophytica]MBB5078778.1 phospholipid/cholesterol/gamma-HCH transport system substrate-binding protein [Nonomuraea endophytica]